MDDLQPLNLLLEQRKQHWLTHCRFVLERLLMPLCLEGHVKTTAPCQRAVVLIDNRIDEQWLFTVLNTWLMCPTDSAFVLIADPNSVTQAEDLGTPCTWSSSQHSEFGSTYARGQDDGAGQFERHAQTARVLAAHPL